MLSGTTKLTDANQRALERRDLYRRELVEGKTPEGSWRKLKLEYPFIGFIDCQVEDIPFTMFSADDDVVAWNYFWAGPDSYEAEIITQWLTWAREAENILDIGAYTGMMSIIAAFANPRCKIHAMEPVERTVERIKINLRANGIEKRVTVHPRAAANEFGPEMINYYREEDFLGTGNSIHSKGKKVFSRRMIQAVNTDQYLGDKHRFDLIKVDVEGFEFETLKGLRRIMNRDRPKIVLELWQENEADVFRLLDTMRYEYKPVEKTPVRVMNYLCVPKD